MRGHCLPKRDTQKCTVIATSDDFVVKIAPRWIVGCNRAGFPDTRPAFDILFSLDCGVCRFKNFEVNQLVDPVLRGVARNEVIPVLMDPPDKVVCYANIQCTTGTTGEDIDVVLFLDRAFLSEMAATSLLSLITALVPLIRGGKALPS